MENTGYKTKFQREKTGTPNTWETIAQVANIQPPSIETDEAEIEELDGDGFKRSLPGLSDAGEVKLTLNLDPENTEHNQLYQDALDKKVSKYRILFPGDAFGWTFSAWVKGYAPSEVTASDVMQVEATLRVTGKPTLGAIVP